MTLYRLLLSVTAIRTSLKLTITLTSSTSSTSSSSAAAAAYRCSYLTGPPHLSELITHYLPSRALRPSSTNLLARPSGFTQGRYHVFKVGGPIPWSMVLLPFYRKKLDKSTQFGAVGYIITLYSSKSYVKSWGSPSKFWGGPDPTPNPPVVASMGITSNFRSHAFSVSAPSTWNSLPTHIRSINLQMSTKVSPLPVCFCCLVALCQRLRFVSRFWQLQKSSCNFLTRMLYTDSY